MNLPNKLTMLRIFMSFVIIAVLLLPFDAMGIEIYKLFINETIVVDVRYLIAGVLFILASLTDFLDGYIARKYHLVTDFGKMIDAIADKILVNSVLIILCAQGFIHPLITVVIIVRDSIVKGENKLFRIRRKTRNYEKGSKTRKADTKDIIRIISNPNKIYRRRNRKHFKQY